MGGQGRDRMIWIALSIGLVGFLLFVHLIYDPAGLNRDDDYIG